MISDREILRKGLSGILRERITLLSTDQYISFDRDQLVSINGLRVLVSRISKETGIKMRVTVIDEKIYVIRL